MTAVLSSVFFFVIALGVLITVHEFGHFWVARKLGVKVLRFSVGFGKPLWSRRGKDGTEYVIAAIPLGGYVKMLDEREAPVAPHELSFAFNRKPLGSRFAIVFAGPLFNFLLAILAYWAVFVIGVGGIKPIVDEVAPHSIAQKDGFQPGDVIVAVNGKQTATWEGVMFALLDKALDRQTVEVRVKDVGQREVTRTLDLSTITGGDLDQGNLLSSIGIRPRRPLIPPVIGHLEVEGAAKRAGLAAGDRIIAADGQPIKDWEEWVKYVQPRAEKVIRLDIERQGQRLVLELRPVAVAAKEGTVGRIGAAVKIPEGELSEELRAVLRYSPGEAMMRAVEKTWDMSLLTLRMLAKMVTGVLSVSNLSGPISIAQYAGYSASAGLVSFLGFLAIVSISLGVLNLLPIPILDGGHLMYYLIEWIKGSPVSEEAQALGQRVGIAVLGTLMIFAFYNDLARLFGSP
ncbi:MAG: sigma E protease regulator RseP [Pseudomonadota bacterium]